MTDILWKSISELYIFEPQIVAIPHPESGSLCVDCGGEHVAYGGGKAMEPGGGGVGVIGLMTNVFLKKPNNGGKIYFLKTRNNEGGYFEI